MVFGIGTLGVFGYAWLRVTKFRESVVRCLCVQVLCREVCLVKCASVVNFVECIVWWSMWVVLV